MMSHDHLKYPLARLQNDSSTAVHRIQRGTYISARNTSITPYLQTDVKMQKSDNQWQPYSSLHGGGHVVSFHSDLTYGRTLLYKYDCR